MTADQSTTEDQTDGGSPGAAGGGQRFGFVAVLGAPNAGKSTLTNRLVGTKVSIVSPKVQTTRTRVTGIFVKDNSQIVLVDTPGIFGRHKDRLQRAMLHAAWSGAEEADMALLLVDVSQRDPVSKAEPILRALPKLGKRVWLVLNKIDTIARAKLLKISAQLFERFDFEQVFMISALNGSGVEDLRAKLASEQPECLWMFPEDQLTDMPTRMLAAEVTREKLFIRLHQELPYSLTVETTKFDVSKKDGSLRIEQTIFVSRTQHKAMVLGKGGRTVKDVGREAREELQDILDIRVHLFLFVKVRENWQNDPERYREMGLDLTGQGSSLGDISSDAGAKEPDGSGDA